ncbi:hypothetical protein [Microbacterium sp. NPDC056234]|uniref:hypothetical protein n=1 Tax=Microbacterium sp. NPDC056234 TaxID=3345757 RepID=UPI0035D7563E
MHTHTITAVPDIPYATPKLSSSRENLIRAGDHLWRVQDGAGRILGHLRIAAEPLGLRYRAERLHLASGAFRLIGEFWTVDEAVQTLRYLR